jgi:putative FmdB family regulatory protein
MPIYCYQCEACGAQQEEFQFRATPPQSLGCRQCGGTARRSYAAEGGGCHGLLASRAGRAMCGEIRSVSAGVMPEQAASATAACARRGLDGVRFDARTGDAIFRDRPSRLRALKAMGLHDRNEIRG